MKWGFALGITLLASLTVLYEWPKINPNQRREKAAFAALIAIAWALAVSLVFFPDMPGPNQAVEFLFKPFGKLLEK